MGEMFADEASLKLLSKSDILKNKTFILHVMVDFEHFTQSKLLLVVWHSI